MCRKQARYPYIVTSALYLEEAAPNFATVILQSASGGLFEGEHLLQRFAVRPSAQACVMTQSSAVVQSMPGGGFAKAAVELIVEQDAYLEYRPRPIVLFPNARLVQQVRVRVATRATVVLSEGFLGHDPEGCGGKFGWLDTRQDFHDLDGTPLVANRGRFSGAEAFGSSPGISQGVHCHGSVIIMAPPDKLPIEGFRNEILKHFEDITDVYAGASALPHRLGIFVRIAARDGFGLNLALETVIRSARVAILGFPPFQFGS